MEDKNHEDIALLRQDLKLHKESSDKVIQKLEEQINELDGRVKKMELSKEKIEYQYEQIMESLKTLNETTIPNLTAQIEELKNKPAKRYDQIVTAVLGALFGAAGAAAAGLFIK